MSAPSYDPNPGILDFIMARLAEDDERDRRRRVFRRYNLGVNAERRRAALTASEWTQWSETYIAGHSWLRAIARHWRRHPDYRNEWHPDAWRRQLGGEHR